MIASHTADCYGGKITLCSVKPDPANRNMVFGLVIHDARNNTQSKLHTGSRVWIAAKQVRERKT